MTKILLLVSVQVIFSFIGTAQNAGLELKKFGTHRTRFIREGSKIKIFTDSGYHRGKLVVISDTSIAVNSDTIVLNKIKDIKTHKVNNYAIPMIVAGTLVTGGSLLIINAHKIKEFMTFEEVITDLVPYIFGYSGTIAGSFTALSGVVIIIVGKHYKSRKWEYEILKP